MYSRHRLLVALAISLAFAAAAAFFAPKAHALPSGFIDELDSSGWNQPVGFTFDPNGRQLVWEKGGKVWIVENGTRLPSPLIDISAEVGNWRDFGMLGFALDPNFLQNGHFYLYYVVDRHHLLHFGTSNYKSTSDDYFKPTIGRITRYTANASDGFRSADPASRLVLLGESKSSGIPILHESHGTGTLLFGTDGSLIASSGDGASYNGTDVGSNSGTYYLQALADGIIRPEENVGAFRSQMLGSLNGKLIRIDPATGDGLPSNPYFDPGSPRSPQSRTWALGFRNPFRIALRPNTGSTDPSIGDPGTIFIGDVGWGSREEINISDAPGQNFGWPIFQGHDDQEDTRYRNTPTENKDVPNPLWGTPGCTKQFLDFQNLIAQAQEDHLPSFPNPCDPLTQLPPSVPKWMHSRPSIDYARSSDDARIGIFNPDGSHAIAKIASPGAPSGDQFRGNCTAGGVWHSGVGFPENFGPSFFHADYGQGSIVRISYDDQNKPLSTQLFHSREKIVFLGLDPTDNSLLYIDIAENEIRRIRFAGSSNLKPVASFSADRLYGPAPLSVTFDASSSSDPEGASLSYSWDFGDGTSATGPNPSRTFSSSTPATFQVTLTVTDPGGQSHSTTLPISVNNSPPSVTINGFQNGSRYPLDAPSTIPLTAAVTDSEHPISSLSFEWQVSLHHGNHFHPEPVLPGQSLSATLSPTPVSNEFYAYKIRHSVTDPLGLTTEATSWLYPERDPALPLATISAPADNALFSPGQPVTVTAEATGTVDRIEFYANGIPVGSDSAAPYSVSFTPTNGAPISIVALAVSGFSSTVSDPVLIRTPSPGSLPSPWIAQDIGTVGAPGSTSFFDGTFSLKGSGRDIWHTSDAFHFVHQKLSGDGEIVAQVSSLPNIHPWAKAGVMLRASLADNAPYAAMVTTPVNGASLQWRPSSGTTTSNRRNPLASAPRWVKIRRTGNTITGYHSVDGTTWTTTSFQTVTLPNTIFVGLCLTSHIDATLGSASLQNVSLSGFGAPGANPPPTVALTSPSNGSSFTNTATVTLIADATDPGGAVAKVAFFSGSTLIAEDTTAPYSLDTVFPVPGNYTLSAVATDDLGATASSSAATITITEDQTGGGLPAAWSTRDIGTSTPGSAAFSSGVYTVRGSGSDIWGTADGLHFASQTLTGDGEITARVLSVQNTHEWAKSGLMIRDGSSSSARYAAMLMTPVGRAAFQYRDSPGAQSKGLANEFFSFPHWIRLTRTGNSFTGYRSADGTSWTQVSSATVTMPATVLVGLAVSSHDPAVTGTSLFDNVFVSGGTGTPNSPPAVTLTSPQNGAQFTSAQSVNLDATASDPGGSIAKVAFFSGPSLIAEITSAPYSASAVFPVAGSYPIHAVATDNLGATTATTPVSITVTPGAGTTPPAPWQGRDIGIVGIPGSASHSAGLFTLQGSGADIWGTRDAFHFLHQPLDGDGEITAKLSAFSAAHAWAKAGVMIRSSFADDATFGSMLITPGTNGGTFIYRTATATHTKMVRHPLATPPRWVRVRRTGNRITAYHSPDGTSWTTVGYLDIPMASAAHIGLAVTSHDNLAVGTAAFESVTVTP